MSKNDKNMQRNVPMPPALDDNERAMLYDDIDRARQENDAVNDANNQLRNEVDKLTMEKNQQTAVLRQVAKIFEGLSADLARIDDSIRNGRMYEVGSTMVHLREAVQNNAKQLQDFVDKAEEKKQ